MKKLALISISLAAFVGLASAQQPAPPAKAPTPPPAAKPAPTADKMQAPPPAVPPKPPAVPAELTDFGKKQGGVWKCTGQTEIMGQMIDTKATLTHKPDANLNKFWIQTTLVATAAKMPPMKATWFTTYDPTAKKLWRVGVNARGGHSTAWGTITDTKVAWEGEAHWAGGTVVKMRITEEMVSAKEVKVTGENSKDGGKTWSKDLEVGCKK